MGYDTQRVWEWSPRCSDCGHLQKDAFQAGVVYAARLSLQGKKERKLWFGRAAEICQERNAPDLSGEGPTVLTYRNLSEQLRRYLGQMELRDHFHLVTLVLTEHSGRVLFVILFSTS